VYFQPQLNGTLDTSSDRTILRIKVIRPSSVLELQIANGRTIRDHSKNCAPCHLPNLDPPLDYPCQICQRTDDVDQMLFWVHYNGGYHLFCLKPELTQIPIGNWYCSSCSLIAPWFLLKPWHVFPSLGLGGDTWEFHLNLLLCIIYIYIYICACISFWLISLYLWLALVFLFSRVYYGFTLVHHDTTRHDTHRASMSFDYLL
jgi:hypothetical protein